MAVRLLKREEIDDKRWNGCVHFALGAMPYAYTWYLDNVAPYWIGLVEGEYQKVMPLPVNKKLGINYIFQPKFCQQLGIFSELPLSVDTINRFFEAIPKEYKFFEFNLNESNLAPMGVESLPRANYILPLEKPYQDISAGYSSNTKRNIQQAQNEGLLINMQMKPETFVDFYVAHTAPKISNFSYKDKYTLLRIIYKAQHYNMGIIIGAYKDNELLAANFFLNHPQRIINLFPSSSEEGRAHNAMAFLMDKVIQTHAGQRKYLDFEGSNIEGVARFYKSFGAEKVNYLKVVKNDLPLWARWLKKLKK